MLKRMSLALALFLGTSAALAADDGPIPRWFRYLDDRGQPTVTDSVTPEHVVRGYDELTETMRLIRHVPAQKPLTAAEIAEAKAKREKEAQQAKDDKQMLRLYSSPQDAERMRDRQLNGLQANIDSSTNSLASLRSRRAEAAQRAATLERTGKPVPTDIKETIATYDRQIQATQKEIDARKAEQEKVRAEYEPVIRRLEILTGKPASKPAAAAVPAGSPAQPAPVAAKAPTKS